MSIDPGRLYPILLNTGLQNKDNALYQLLYNLIGNLIDVKKQISNTTPGGGGGGTVINNNTIVNPGLFAIDGLDGEDGTIGPSGPIGPVGPQGPSGGGGSSSGGVVFIPSDDENEQLFVPSQTIFTGNNLPASLSISQDIQPTSLNVTTEGTIDWVVPNGNASTQAPRQIGPPSVHSKASGGWLMLGLDYVITGGSYFQQDDIMQVTSNAGDDTALATLANSVKSQGVFKATGTNFGWRLIAPPSPIGISTLKIYCSVFSGEMSISVYMPLDFISGVTVINSGAGSLSLKMITIQYCSKGPLTVTGLLTTNLGSTPNVKIQAATLSTI